MNSLFKNIPGRILSFAIGFITVVVLFSCSSDSSSITATEEPEEPDFTLKFSGVVNRDFTAIPGAELSYRARVETTGERQNVFLEFAANQEQTSVTDRSQLSLSIPVTDDGFQLETGNYALNAQPISAITFRGRLQYQQKRDELNYERYVFIPEFAGISIDEVSENHLSGRIDVRCTQSQGVRSVNGVVEEVQLAYNGSITAYINFDITLGEPTN